ncbi:MAG: hypothetical protein U9R58_04425 [Chloroflexota bacterium]|nr:hypothetical protein [Chloroflexota bacterium]
MDEHTDFIFLDENKMHITIILILLYVCMPLFLASCQSSWQQPIPDGEIVYMSYLYDPYELGFFHANGGNNQTLEIDQAFEKPVWSNDGKFLFGLSGGIASYIGYPAYWDLEKGCFKVCNDLPYFGQIQGSGNVENPYEVIIQGPWEIIVMDLSRCVQVQTLVDYTADPGDFSIGGFSYSPSTQELVYGLVYNDREYKIMLLDIKTGEQFQLAEGINPTWSPDGTRIAYLGLDGLYVMLSNGAEPRQLVNQPFFDALRIGNQADLRTVPRWSPDGEWLVYHRCSTPNICMMEDAQIYKIRSSGGSEEKILTGGQYPSWRP